MRNKSTTEPFRIPVQTVVVMKGNEAQYLFTDVCFSCLQFNSKEKKLDKIWSLIHDDNAYDKIWQSLTREKQEEFLKLYWDNVGDYVGLNEALSAILTQDVAAISDRKVRLVFKQWVLENCMVRATKLYEEIAANQRQEELDYDRVAIEVAEKLLKKYGYKVSKPKSLTVQPV